MPASHAPTRTFLVAYDVAGSAHAGPALAEAIMSVGDAWARPLETVWVLRTTRSADDIEACLAPLVGDDDGLVVQETRGEPRLANTGLRWFKPRRPAEAVCQPAADASPVVLAFPDSRIEPGRAARRREAAAGLGEAAPSREGWGRSKAAAAG